MKIILLSWLFFIPLFQILSGKDVLLVSGQCLEDQKSLLLILKDSLTSPLATSPKLVGWNGNIDCCGWDGVKCGSSGHVVKLELDNQTLSGEIANSSTLFKFQYLERLNLAYNNFNSSIPSGLYKLTNLRYLNLSNAGFVGQIPSALGSMRRLVILDLSTRFPGVERLKVENPSLKILFENLTELRELYLDGVNISAPGSGWCSALSSLSNLRVLSLSTCYLSGPIDDSLLQLSSLSVINLDNNNLSAKVPDTLSNFSNLTTLSLSSCYLQGNFPEKILQVPTLQNLDLSNNNQITGIIPKFPLNGSLKKIALSYTNFSGSLPDSIGFLGNLSHIDLSNSNFSGPIPSTMANLTELVYLDLSFNKFNGSIPSFQTSKSLKYMDLSRNHLTGTISSTHFKGLVGLSFINLGFNSLEGGIPPFLFTLPSLQKLELSNNKFAGHIDEFRNAAASTLDTLDLSGNQLEGSIPKSFFELERLNVLSLSSNNFSGTLRLDMISRLRKLTKLELSYNKLSMDVISSNSSWTYFSQLSILKLASCNLKTFPNLENQSMMNYLDLSDNQIAGEIPRWIWKVGNGNLLHLNLSCNLLVGRLQNGYPIDSLLVLDLHSNLLQGDIPIPPVTAIYVDYSSNYFNNSIPTNIGSSISWAVFFSLSNNSLTGAIPESICNASYIQVLDLSRNALTGSIPDCLFEGINLKVLHLGNNRLNGTIPDNFPANCSLKTLDLSRNGLGGVIPDSLVNCKSLEVLNIGCNKVEDTFPCMLKDSSSLRVLVLRSNMFHGNLSCSPADNSWQNLQIIDIAFNNFSGTLSSRSISNWRGMLSLGENGQSSKDHLHTDFLSLTNLYYQDTLTVNVKGLELELVKILTVFTSIDFSGNNFEGNIPGTVGDLKALYVLNFANNSFSGTIPNSIGNLTQLESLDLSSNRLTGRIPTQLTGLTFLSFLNLSFNQLSGSIPAGPQFQTFSETSFEGNIALCGFPLNTSCSGNATGIQPSPASNDANFAWQFIFTGLGFGVGAAVILAPLIVCQEVRDWCDKHLEKNLQLIFPRYKFCYTRYNEGKVEAANNFEDDFLDDIEDSDADEYEEDHEALGGKYCVFCSKLDLYRNEVVHDPKCTCHSAPPVYFTSPTSSSSLLILYQQNF